MEAARTSETLVNFYQTTRCYNPEDSNLHTHRCENLKSYLRIVRIEEETLSNMILNYKPKGYTDVGRQKTRWREEFS
jgi:hypothetical protein